MKIVVCIKQVPDTNEVKLDPKTNRLIRDGVPSIICRLLDICHSCSLDSRYSTIHINGFTCKIRSCRSIINNEITSKECLRNFYCIITFFAIILSFVVK